MKTFLQQEGQDYMLKSDGLTGPVNVISSDRESLRLEKGPGGKQIKPCPHHHPNRVSPSASIPRTTSIFCQVQTTKQKCTDFLPPLIRSDGANVRSVTLTCTSVCDALDWVRELS